MKTTAARPPTPLGPLLTVALAAVVVAAGAIVFGIAVSRNPGPLNTPEPTDPTATWTTETATNSPTATRQPTSTATATATPTQFMPTAAPTATPPVLQNGGTAITANLGGDRLNVRSGPGTVFQIVASLLEGEAVSLTSDRTAGGNFYWWRVELLDGTTGWMADAPAGGGQAWLLPLDSSSPIPFQAVAKSVQRAVSDADPRFFWRSALTALVNCSEVPPDTVYGCVGEPAGAQVAVLGVVNAFEGTSYGRAQYERLLQGWFAAAHPDLADAYGPGGALLYATAVSRYPGGPQQYHAVVTFISVPRAGARATRQVLVFTWELIAGHWRHTRLWMSERQWDHGYPPPASWLAGGCAVGGEECLSWERWP